MEITVAELAGWAPGSYLLYDIRGERERAYGCIPGAVARGADELLADPPRTDLPLILYCARGVISEEPAEQLSEMGYRAYSLREGYAGWLRAHLAGGQAAEVTARVEQGLRTTYKTTLLSPFLKAVKQYALIRPGDRIAVCMSGGKDSMLMAKLFQELARHSKVPFEAKYLVMDPGYNEANRRIIEDNARLLGIPVTIFESDIFESVFHVDKSPCYLCARMRRGHLYHYAQELGCNKIALGHHFDDVIETTLMGMLWGSQIQTMMPKLHSTNFPGMELIRPMYCIREDDIKAWRDANDLHFIQCACKFTDTCTTCNNGNNHSKRQETKELIRTLKRTNPNVETCLFNSMQNVCLDTVIAYKQKGVRHHFLDTYDAPAVGEGTGAGTPEQDDR